MFPELTRQRVLVMEWVEGRRLRRAGQDGSGPTRAELAEDLKLVEIGVQCSLEQVLLEGTPPDCMLLLRDRGAVQPGAGAAGGNAS
jgi:hypothetical protein